METELETKPAPIIPIDRKEEEFFIERLAQILFMQIESEDENKNEKLSGVHTAV